ncbi:MAG: flagellar basal body rod C-terminal domain-containing protein [Balneolales bacterium]
MDRLFSVFQTSGQGLAVQRRQVQIASENLANAETTRAGGETYKPKRLDLTQPAGDNFRIALQNSTLKMQNSNSRHIPELGSNHFSQETKGLGPEARAVEESRYRYEYDPAHPDSDANGMVKYPDVDLIEETTRLVSANRLYEANLSVIEAEKEIIKKSFEI